jgi:hypothetical protein
MTLLRLRRAPAAAIRYIPLEPRGSIRGYRFFGTGRAGCSALCVRELPGNARAGLPALRS